MLYFYSYKIFKTLECRTNSIWLITFRSLCRKLIITKSSGKIQGLLLSISPSLILMKMMKININKYWKNIGVRMVTSSHLGLYYLINTYAVCLYFFWPWPCCLYLWPWSTASVGVWLNWIALRRFQRAYLFSQLPVYHAIG